MDEQLELPLEWAKHAEYSIEVRKGPTEEKVRSHHAETVEDATTSSTAYGMLRSP